MGPSLAVLKMVPRAASGIPAILRGFCCGYVFCARAGAGFTGNSEHQILLVQFAAMFEAVV